MREKEGLWLHDPWVWTSFPLALEGRVQPVLLCCLVGSCLELTHGRSEYV